MFKSKSFFIWLFLAIFLSVLSAIVYSKQKNSIPEIFNYVPTNVDQIMINWAEKNLKNNLSSVVEIPYAVQEQFQKIQLMVIVQDRPFDENGQLMFLQTKPGFVPELFLETINPEDEIIFTYLRLDKWQYLFAAQQLIQNYTKPSSDNSLFWQKDIKPLLPSIKKSSLTIISADRDSLLPEGYSGPLSSIKYIITNINSDSQSNFGFSLYAITDSHLDYDYSFESKFSNLFIDSTIAYLELGKISQSLDSNWENSDFFQKLLSNNIAIIIGNWANMFNLWLTVVSDNSSLYNDLEPFFPFVLERLKSYPLFEWIEITSVQQPWKIWYDFLIQNIQKIWLYLEQKDWQTKLSLWNPQTDWKSQKLKKHSKNSLAILQVDMWKLLNLYKQFTDISLLWLSDQQQDLFSSMQDKTLFWEIFFSDNYIWIQGFIQ